ncbi:MAG TPA: DUF2244 domain-containing protein [Gammaproteobacteria bacterium]|nr:DUF2244 domain-containing protein [Gammaproteobacteria bacterium]
MLEIELDAACQRIVMVPNRSLTRTGLWLFYGSLSVVTLALASWFTLHGFWPVMVYAVLELIWLGLCQRLCWQRSGYSEQIVVTGDTVIVDQDCSRHRHQHMEFNRYWARVVVKEPDARLHSRKLFIRSHGRECEVGRCLTDTERDRLEQRLASLIGPLANTGRA